MRRLLIGLISAAAVLVVAMPGPVMARQSTMYQAPDFCQVFDDFGQIITLAWGAEGCHTDRYAFAAKIAGRKNSPGWYPPMTCIAQNHRFDWDAPACAHARNKYARGAIRAQYFGTPPRRS
jgi:hypothetical protein